MSAQVIILVEGQDDLYSIANILSEAGVQVSEKSADVDAVRIIKCGGKDLLLTSIKREISLSESAVGIVLDADESPHQRYQAIRGRLSELGVSIPKKLPSDGLVCKVKPTDLSEKTIGVWLMPDNRNSGMLEDFLRDLIDEDDRLVDFALKCVSDAVSIDRRFPLQHKSKAVMHTWLAWQENIGCPFGTAVTHRYLRPDCDAAIAFISWVKRLYSQRINRS